MSVVPSSAVLVLSVDLELDVPQRADRARQQALAAVSSRLIELFSRLEMPATWAVADPAISAATERILAGRVTHEVAVLGDSTWVGRDAGRGRFARELIRRVSHAREAGLPVSTLALRNCDLDDHLDLLVKHGIHAVRGNSHVEFSPALSLPRTLRHGLREFGVSQRLPVNGGFLSRYRAGRYARRRLRWAIGDRGVFHLLIDGPRLSDGRGAALRPLDRLLRRAATYRDRGELTIDTVAQAAVRFLPARMLPPAMSIMHPAA